jgi:cysteinyl-tRNA synthetase
LRGRGKLSRVETAARSTALALYDTWSRTVRQFTPLGSGPVGLYTCGPTVYDYAHIGNLRTYVFEDVLRRALAWNGYAVKHVMNITDVGHLTSDADTGEDKVEVGSRRTGKSAWEIADLYTQAFMDDLRRLDAREPTVWCKATDHISEQIAFIECIDAKGYTYRTSDGIYFDTSKLSDYGHLGRLDLEGLRAGERVEVGEKRRPTDFALWKFSPAGQTRQMQWPSPWGVGFPGWHIECSAMSARYLGPFFDIHCGGEDHVPVHHTNEIAQTQACYGTRLANFWMHGTFLQLDDAKMSKSAGSFLTLRDLIERGYDPLAYRFFCLGAHYRARLSFSWEALDGAATALTRLRAALDSWGPAGAADHALIERFTTEVNGDLNMPRALAVVWELVRSDLPPAVKKATLLRVDEVLGLALADWAPAEVEVPEAVKELVEARQRARADKRWTEADTLRAQVSEAGYEIEDTPQGPRVRARTARP